MQEPEVSMEATGAWGGGGGGGVGRGGSDTSGFQMAEF